MIDLDNLKIPKHIAIILDGNRRWAKKKFLPKKLGHKTGMDTLEKILKAADKFGVKYLSVYAFSTENWNREQTEVDDLMKIFDGYLDRYIKRCHENNLRVRIIGDVSRLNFGLKEKIKNLEEMTAEKNGMNFIIAINYGGRDEILRALKKICDDISNKKILLDQITKEKFADYLDTKNIPEPDLLIRTGGEKRISNFMLWQLAYTEFYFCDKLWPDFNENDLKIAIEDFSMRQRRFGG